MAGITRINITNPKQGRGAYRFKKSQGYWNYAIKLYRNIFMGLGYFLEEGTEVLDCEKGNVIAGYDELLGIDVLFRFTNGMTSTLQEKFLFVKNQTVTVEYYNNPNPDVLDEGDWFHLKANYYFVGYDRLKSKEFQEWILIDWPALQRETLLGNVNWQGPLPNRRDGARANFKFVEFDHIPKSCVLVGFWNDCYYPQGIKLPDLELSDF